MRHCRALRQVLFLTALSCVAGATIAAETTVSGSFDDPTNTALISSNGDNDLGPAQFGSDNAVARNVAIYQLVVPQDNSTIRFDSSGYYTGGQGADDGSGAEPYFSIFSGSDTSATFLDSSYFDPNIDFMVAETLAAGTYLFTIGLYENESLAENSGPPYGTLSEGFTALGDPDLLGDGFYRVAVTSDDADFTVGAPGPIVPTGPAGPPTPIDVPEPGVMALLIAGLAAFGVHRRRTAFSFFDKGSAMIATNRRRLRLSISTLIASAALVCIATDAAAQSRPALVRDTDNPALTPFRFHGVTNGAYQVSLPAVPTGKRLVVQNVSYSGGYTAGTLLFAQLVVSGDERVALGIPPAQTNGPSPSYSYTTPVTAYFEAGEVPIVLLETTNGTGGYFDVMVAGYYVTP